MNAMRRRAAVALALGMLGAAVSGHWKVGKGG
jgi:hypothetical protein